MSTSVELEKLAFRLTGVTTPEPGEMTKLEGRPNKTRSGFVIVAGANSVLRTPIVLPVEDKPTSAAGTRREEVEEPPPPP
jgi:hypothetical protein